MRPVLFDTSVYITALRACGDAGSILRRLAANSPVWLSSVVIEELYAGASATGRRSIERLERDFDRAGRILVPNLTDWTQTGKVLALLGARHGFERIGRGRLTNDTLVATSAGRLGIVVVTANSRDFGRIAEFRPFEWRLSDAPES